MQPLPVVPQSEPVAYLCEHKNYDYRLVVLAKQFEKNPAPAWHNVTPLYTASQINDAAARENVAESQGQPFDVEEGDRVVMTTQQASALLRDAARYRFLRDVAPSMGNRVPHITQYPPADFDGDKYLLMQIDKWGMDAAIEAAMFPAAPEHS